MEEEIKKIVEDEEIMEQILKSIEEAMELNPTIR